MKREPLRTVLAGYALVAALVAAAGLGALGALAILWFGGAAAVIALSAARMALRRPAADHVAIAAEELSAAAAADLARWEADSAQEAAAAMARLRRGGPISSAS